MTQGKSGEHQYHEEKGSPMSLIIGYAYRLLKALVQSAGLAKIHNREELLD